MKLWIATLLLFAVTLSSLSAVESGGFLIDVQKVSLERHDQGHGGYSHINRTMALKINIKNNNMKDLEATTLKYVILVQKRGSMGRIERTEGELKLEKLPASRSVSVSAGEIDIKGFMGTTSATRHVDQIAGWKITIIRDGHPIDFLSNTNFDTLNKRAEK